MCSPPLQAQAQILYEIANYNINEKASAVLRFLSLNLPFTSVSEWQPSSLKPLPTCVKSPQHFGNEFIIKGV